MKSLGLDAHSTSFTLALSASLVKRFAAAVFKSPGFIIAPGTLIIFMALLTGGLGEAPFQTPPSFHVPWPHLRIAGSVSSQVQPI